MPLSSRVGSSASEDRLEKLVQQRLKPGADRKAIDKRIWNLFGEKWCIMFTDLSGFSRNVQEFGIIHFLQTIYESKRLLIPVIDDYDGILLKVEADSLMILFRNPKRAVECSIAMQKVLKEYNEATLEVDDILLCIGLGYGQMLKIGDHDVYGHEVNAASKLGEDKAEPWEVLITENVKKFIEKDYEFEEYPDTPAGIDHAYKLVFSIEG